jgi:hypothetical protein
MKTNRTYNPCDECHYSYSKIGEESSMCKICEFMYYLNLRPKQGKWLFNKWAGQEYYKCSCCGKDYPLPPTWNAYDFNKYLKYCSSCGAKKVAR